MKTKKSKNFLKVTLSDQDGIVPDTHNYVTVSSRRKEVQCVLTLIPTVTDDHKVGETHVSFSQHTLDSVKPPQLSLLLHLNLRFQQVFKKKFQSCPS